MWIKNAGDSVIYKPIREARHGTEESRSIRAGVYGRGTERARAVGRELEFLQAAAPGTADGGDDEENAPDGVRWNSDGAAIVEFRFHVLRHQAGRITRPRFLEECDALG